MAAVLRQGERERRVAHLHVMVADTARWAEQLALRDALRADLDPLDAYASLKRDLAARHASDRERDSSAKAEFVRAALEQDAATPQRDPSIGHARFAADECGGLLVAGGSGDDLREQGWS